MDNIYLESQEFWPTLGCSGLMFWAIWLSSVITIRTIERLPA